jgi:hypothetical protein
VLSKACLVLLHMTEKIDISKLLHFLDVDRLNNLFIVKKDPGVAILAINLLANKGHIVSVKMSAIQTPSFWGSHDNLPSMD